MPNILKRVPPWAYVASAGVVGGVAAFRFISRKGDTVGTDDSATAVGDSGNTDQSGGGVGTGVIIPPVVIGGQQDNELAAGYQNLQDLFVGGTNTLIDQFQNLFSGLGDTIQGSYEGGAGIAIQGVETGAGIVRDTIALTGGGAPSAPVAQPAPQQSSPSPPPAGPAPCGPDFPIAEGGDCYKFAWNYETRRSGKNVWCVRMPRHIYRSGRDVTLTTQADKIHDGAC
jgi:hypothetical protein